MKFRATILLAIALAAVYGIADLLDSVQVLRQTLIAPGICIGILISMLLSTSPESSPIQALDVDHTGYLSTLLRISVFAVLAFAVLLPWATWYRTRKRSHLIVSIAVLTLYLITSVGFVTVVTIIVSGMRT